MEDTPFATRSALVIGGTSGIGAELAQLLHAAGAAVTVTGRHSPERDQPFRFAQTDFSAGLSCLQSLDSALKSTDVLAVCYGPFVQKPLHLTTDADWERMALSNYALPGMVLSRVLPGMCERGWGRIVLFGGTRTDAVRAYRSCAAYAGAKTGVSVLVKSVAAEYGTRGVTCNAVLPGFTRNPPSPEFLIPAALVAQQAFHLLATPALNGVLLTADRGWHP